MLLGLAVGDALGAYLEFEDAREPENYLREYKAVGPHNLPAGCWTDDTSMALAMADSLLIQRGKVENWIPKICWPAGVTGSAMVPILQQTHALISGRFQVNEFNQQN